MLLSKYWLLNPKYIKSALITQKQKNVGIKSYNFFFFGAACINGQQKVVVVRSSSSTATTTPIITHKKIYYK